MPRYAMFRRIKCRSNYDADDREYRVYKRPARGTNNNDFQDASRDRKYRVRDFLLRGTS